LDIHGAPAPTRATSMKNFRAGTVSGVSQDEIVKNILVEGKHPSILILRHLRQNSIFFDGHSGGALEATHSTFAEITFLVAHSIPSPFRTDC
jgi:hypothetical protein